LRLAPAPWFFAVIESDAGIFERADEAAWRCGLRVAAWWPPYLPGGAFGL
jgi:hypothetical protein